MSVPQWASSGIVLILFLFCVVFCRAQATYWLGRGIVSGAVKGRGKSKILDGIAKFFEGSIPRKGTRIIETWGIAVIPLCFLTVGLQTAVIAGAGVLRMAWPRFTLAMIPGCVAWALLYGMGLLAVWMTVLGALAGNPWGWVAFAVIVTGFLILWQIRRHKGGKTEREDRED